MFSLIWVTLWQQARKGVGDADSMWQWSQARFKPPHITPNIVPYPAGTHTNTFFQRSLKIYKKKMYFSSGFTTPTSLKPFVLCCTSNPCFPPHVNKFTALFLSCWSKEKQIVRRDNLVKRIEWGHCLYLIPVKTVQGATFPFLFFIFWKWQAWLCVDVNINSNNNSQQQCRKACEWRGESIHVEIMPLLFGCS